MKQDYLIKARQFAETLQARSDGDVSEEPGDACGPARREAFGEPGATDDVVQDKPNGSHGPVSGRVSLYTAIPWPTRREIEQAVEDWRAMRASSILAGIPE